LKTIIFALYVLFSLNCYARDASIFGIAIGQDIATIPDCLSEEGKTHICMFPPNSPSATAQRFVELRPEKPKWITSNLWLTVANNKIKEIYIRTGGEPAQQDAFAYMKRTFGKPTDVKYIQLQNAYGANYKSVEAMWIFTNGSGALKGIDENVTEGSILLISN